MDEFKYYSQDGQDKYLDQTIFSQKTGGFFIEIGANDGITLSNTFFFEKHRQWSGICVEPHPSAFSKLKNNRRVKLINACIADSENDKEFLKIEGYSEMLSGLMEKYDPTHLKRIDDELTKFGGSKEIVKISCIKLDTIIKQYASSGVDYCSIDTEGGELDILETANLKENEIKVISVENNYYGKSLGNFFKKYGYKELAKIGADEFYLKKQKSFFSFFNS